MSVSPVSVTVAIRFVPLASPKLSMSLPNAADDDAVASSTSTV